MKEIERAYEYKPKWTVIVGCAVFFGLCAVFLGDKARANQRGLILEGFELSADSASTFYGVLLAAKVDAARAAREGDR